MKILHDTWLPLLIAAYISTGIDVAVTSFGILTGKGAESNPLITWIPDPTHQIFYITMASIIAFWGIFFLVSYAVPRYNALWIKPFVSVGMLVAVFTHLWGVSTWL